MPTLPGHRPPLVDALGPHRPCQRPRLTVTLLLEPVDEPLRTQLAARRREDPGVSLARASLLGAVRPPAARLALLARHLTGSGLRPLPAPGGLLLRFEGDATAVGRAFGVRLLEADVGEGGPRHFPDGDPSLPSPLAPYVLAVYGLDDLARPARGAPVGPASDGPSGLLPEDVARLYAFPRDFSGAGETITLLVGRGAFRAEDLAAFWRRTGVRRAWPTVLAGGPDGAADPDTTLAAAWAGALAPGAGIVVPAAPDVSSYAEGLALGMTHALADPRHAPTVLVMGDGDGETAFAPAPARGLDRLAELLAAAGVTVLAASGHGNGDPAEAHLPAALPHVTAVGGTTPRLGAGPHLDERPWPDQGGSAGATSRLFPRPGYQEGWSAAFGRAVPDLALAADPVPGFAVVLDGAWRRHGGTLAAAVTLAALVVRLNEARRRSGRGRLGFLNPWLARLAGRGLRPLGAPGPWHPQSGWGAPLGEDLCALVTDA
jgi:kumamolisin